MNAHAAVMMSLKGSILRLGGALRAPEDCVKQGSNCALYNLISDEPLPPPSWYEHGCGLQTSV